MIRIAPYALAAALLSACTADKDSTATDDTGGDSVATDDSGGQPHFTLEGTAIAFGPARDPAPEGACAQLLDPTGGIEGGEPTLLGETTIGAEGAYSFTDVPIPPTLPLVLIDDCDSTTPRVFPTATPLQPELMLELSDGAVVSGNISVVLGTDVYDTLVAALGAAGSTVDTATDGMLLGFVWDKATQAPIAGATIDCAGCTVYYGDGDSTDGPFSTGGSLNTATSADAFWISPAAPIGDYGATASGYSFQTTQMGAIPRAALFALLLGE